MSREVCHACGAIQMPSPPAFDAPTRVDGFGSLHFGGITVHDWGGDPDLDWPADRPPWRFYGFFNGLSDWSPEGYPDAASAARAAWFDAFDPRPACSTEDP